MKLFKRDRFSAEVRTYGDRGNYPDQALCLDDDDPDDLLAQAHEAICDRMGDDDFDPFSAVQGKGPTLFIGYDAEWVNKKSPTQLDPPRPLRTLSYQIHSIGCGGEQSIIFFPQSGAVSDRLTLRELLDFTVEQAMKAGVVAEMPREIVLSGFFLRADLAMLVDLAEFKHELSNIGGKIGTVGKGLEIPLVYRARDIERLERSRAHVKSVSGISCLTQVHFIDMAKHAPEKTPLSALGDLVGLPKLKLPQGYDISLMDKLLAEVRESFVEYALRDAEIVVLYYLRVLAFAREHVFKNGRDGKLSDEVLIPPSAGAMAVQLSRLMFEQAGHDYQKLFGMKTQKSVKWDKTSGLPRTQKIQTVTPHRKFHEQFAIDCYLGGRNETFWVGPTDEGIWHDFDLIGAYTTGMLLIKPIRFEASYESCDLADFTHNTMGFAWVEFEFPPDTRMPSLPVVTEQGLKWPLKGESFCTAPEISLALRQKVKKLVIKRGVIYPQDEKGTPIFLEFVRMVRYLRAKYGEEGNALFEAYVKLLGNSLYGKTGQGLKGKSAFDTMSNESHKIPMSAISCGPIAAFITGFVRAVLGEILHGIPAQRTVVSCTTDGILCNASEDELNLSGPLCQQYLALCELAESGVNHG